jgi:hypothetical protein
MVHWTTLIVCWDSGFKSLRVPGRLSLVSVVRCQIFSASGWTVIQRNPTECGGSECDRKASIMRPGQLGAVAARKKKLVTSSMLPRKVTNDESERIWNGGHWCGVIYPADNCLGVSEENHEKTYQRQSPGQHLSTPTPDLWCWIATNPTTTFSDTLNETTSFDFRYRSPFVRNKPVGPLQWRKLRSIPTKEEIVLFSAESRVAVVANQPLVQCVPSALPPRDKVAGCNVDNSHLVRDQELVQPNHFLPVRLHGVVRNVKPSDPYLLLHTGPVSFDSAGNSW